MTAHIRIYVEGGGDGKDTRAVFRRGFTAFFRDLDRVARRRKGRLSVIACGGRSSVFDDFRNALQSHADAVNVLLVDSEFPVRRKPWSHLEYHDKIRPFGVPDDFCQLMVQCMEAWLFADKDTLAKYYGKGFIRGALSKSANVEIIERNRGLRELEKATRHTSKGGYHKIQHGPALLGLLDVSKVRRASRHCDRIFTTLANRMGTTL